VAGYFDSSIPLGGFTLQGNVPSGQNMFVANVLASQLAATLNNFSISAGQSPQFSIVGVPGFNYAVEVSSNLLDWTPLLTNASPLSFVDTNAAAQPQRFYRALWLP
jgi:hypothetical protein